MPINFKRLYEWLAPGNGLRKNSVEEVFCKKFEKLPCMKMRMEEEMLFELMQTDNYQNIALAGFERSQLQDMVQRVVQQLTVVIELRVMFLLNCISSRIAIFVMYVIYIQYWAKKHNERMISLDILRTRIFPNGFPDEKDLKDLWYAQKIDRAKYGTDNLLDKPEALESIQF